ncbi:MAG: NfeD family protein [Gemmatimonadaceae bacterium]
MTVLWLVAATFGLVLLVFVMIAGVPKREPPLTPGAASRPRTLLPTFGAFCTATGITGYLTRNRLVAWGLGSAGIAVAVGALAAVLARWVVVRAFAKPSSDPEDDPQYRFQGHVARVTKPIGHAGSGRIAFEADGHRYNLRARSVDGSPVPANTEVVIERIDGDLATVELWASVEQRL